MASPGTKQPIGEEKRNDAIIIILANSRPKKEITKCGDTMKLFGT